MSEYIYTGRLESLFYKKKAVTKLYNTQCKATKFQAVYI